MIGWLIGAWVALLLACACIKNETVLLCVLVGVVVIAALARAPRSPGRRRAIHQRRDR